MSRIFRSAFVLALIFQTLAMDAQVSVAHTWSEANLFCVRQDISRPTITARRLWYNSLAMYDAWAVYDSIAEPFALGNGYAGTPMPFNGIAEPANRVAAQEEAISYACYRVLDYHYPGWSNDFISQPYLDSIFLSMGYNKDFTSIDYSTGSPAALGNYIASRLIIAGQNDGANETLSSAGTVSGYGNAYYHPVNDSLPIQEPHFIGNPFLDSLNRYQPLDFVAFCFQTVEQPFINVTIPFLSPEWGNVQPFSLSDSIMDVKQRAGHDWKVFHDPGHPPYADFQGGLQTDDYRWGMELVAKWTSHLDPDDTTLMDASPASIGNIPLSALPNDPSEYPSFYDEYNGGDASVGHTLNPATGQPYPAQIVKRADYARILAEFWADGPDSETPPGHWVGIYNQISHDPDFTWKWMGQGPVLSQLDYDVRTYFTLSGTMHDAAIAAWSIKGYYDYVRPVSSLRAMAELGQSSDPALPNFHPAGLKLDPGYIEMIEMGDPLAGDNNEYVGEVKMKTWLGPLDGDTCLAGYPIEYDTAVAHVGWRLALDYWPYQRPSFITPPFAGFVSGHSTFSRAAAESMTLMTGDRFFPGGVGEFLCPQDQFLVFERGPSEDITLQWATYQDASDQCSLSRIWGGIHPPADDIPGRKIGYEVGHNAFALANRYINGGQAELISAVWSDDVLTEADLMAGVSVTLVYDRKMDAAIAPTVVTDSDLSAIGLTATTGSWINDSTFVQAYSLTDTDQALLSVEVGVTVEGARTQYGIDQADRDAIIASLIIDTENPVATATIDQSTADQVDVTLTFTESMDQSSSPSVSFPVEDAPAAGLTLDAANSQWMNSSTYLARYTFAGDFELYDIDLEVASALDSMGNVMTTSPIVDAFTIDNVAPTVATVATSTPLIYDANAGSAAYTVTFDFSEAMDPASTPTLSYVSDEPVENTLVFNSGTWSDADTYEAAYDIVDANEDLGNVTIELTGGADRVGNMHSAISTAAVTIDMLNPEVLAVSPSLDIISNAELGSNFNLDISFGEVMDMTVAPTTSFDNASIDALLSPNASASAWQSDQIYRSAYDIAVMAPFTSAAVDLSVESALDANGNVLLPYDELEVFSVDILTGLDNLALDGISIFPNPVDRGTELRITGLYGTSIVITITDALGRFISQSEAATTQDGEQWIIDTSDLSSGAYQISFQSQDDQRSYRFQVID